jgi:transcriptional regulator with XRE-family HTH domain
MATIVKPLNEFEGIPQNILDAAAGVVFREGHENPHLGRFVKGFRLANNLSQVKLARGEDIEGVGEDVSTTHAQIAMLEQGNCKGGAKPNTVALLSQAAGVPAELIQSLNQADIADRVKPAKADGSEGDSSDESDAEPAPAAKPAKSTARKHSKAKSTDAPAQAPVDTPEPIAL